GTRAGAKQSPAQRGLAFDSGVRKALTDCNADKRAREVDATRRHHQPLARECAEALAGQDEHVGVLAAARDRATRGSAQSRHRSALPSTLRIDRQDDAPLPSGPKLRARGQCRPSAAQARRINLSTAVSRRLRLPASAVASNSAPSSSQLPEKPMPTSWPPNTELLPLAGVCSWLRICPFQRPFSEV